ncbi:hypothetical protein WKS98_09755 [Lagierella sp. ICN-221743]
MYTTKLNYQTYISEKIPLELTKNKFGEFSFNYQGLKQNSIVIIEAKATGWIDNKSYYKVI